MKYRTREIDKHDKKHTLSNNFLLKCSSSNSDSEPFYLHPPPMNNNRQKEKHYFENNYYNPMPNDGIFVNPMRTAFAPPSPSESGESFFLHDPHEVIYNRVKDIFESDTSGGRDEPFTKKNAMTVKAEIHSTSSGTTSDEEPQERVMTSTDKNNNAVSNNHNSNHDYEDIYLVREEAKTTSKVNNRSRSRDSGSHSRSASTSSTRSHEVIVQTKIIVSPLNF